MQRPKDAFVDTIATVCDVTVLLLSRESLRVYSIVAAVVGVACAGSYVTAALAAHRANGIIIGASFLATVVVALFVLVFLNHLVPVEEESPLA